MRTVAVVTLSVVVAVAIAGQVWGQQQGPPRDPDGPSTTNPTTPTPAPVTPPPTGQEQQPMPAPASTAPVTPAVWQLPARNWEALPTPAPQGDVWAALQVPGLLDEKPPVLQGCPAPRTVTTEQEFRRLVRQQWDCVHTAWAGAFTRHGWLGEEPAVEFFPGAGSDSACGYLEAPAFYCSDGAGTAHFGAGHMDMALEWDLSINEMVNHEYVHHVQSVAGITAAKTELGPSDEMERRAELQATCLSAAMTHGNAAIGFDQDDWDSWHQRLETTIIDDVHGSRESILYWGTRGLYAKTLGDCNTWAVDADRVS